MRVHQPCTRLGRTGYDAHALLPQLAPVVVRVRVRVRDGVKGEW